MRAWATSFGLCVLASASTVASAQWSATSLHPPGYQFGTGAYAAFGNQQYGSGTAGHAGFWSGTAGSFVDLHPPGLPPQFVPSTTVLATDGTQQGGTTTVVVLGFGNVMHATR